MSEKSLLDVQVGKQGCNLDDLMQQLEPDAELSSSSSSSDEASSSAAHSQSDAGEKSSQAKSTEQGGDEESAAEPVEESDQLDQSPTPTKAEATEQTITEAKQTPIIPKTKRGVVYFSTIPPFMRPQKLVHLLEQFGKVTRVYVTPEDKSMRRRRVKKGGTRRKKFVNGWVEFKKRRVAEAVASMLNATKIGGKKRSFYYDDLWNCKYLPGFTWSDLTEEVSRQNVARQDRLRREIGAFRGHYQQFAKQVERASVARHIQSRQRKRGRADDRGDGGATNGPTSSKRKVA